MILYNSPILFVANKIGLLFSQGSNIFPVGTILPYIGDLSKIPYGWALCDGKNGTPDLRDRFLTGTGLNYNLHDTGGENFHKLTIEEMPSHNHLFVGDDDIVYPWGVTGQRIQYDAESVPEYRPGGQVGYTSFSGNNRFHENRPPYYAVYYIMCLR